MITFSSDPRTADEQVHAIIFYLITFGYIDGQFDESEKVFIRDYIKNLALWRCQSANAEGPPEDWSSLVDKYIERYNRVFDRLDFYVRELFTEAVAEGEDLNTFVYAKLKLRCFEIFHSFDSSAQSELLETVDELIAADGIIHPSEVQFRDELTSLLHCHIPLHESDIPVMRTEVQVTVDNATQVPVVRRNHPFFERMERHYSRDPNLLKQQVAADHHLMTRAMQTWSRQRSDGVGKAIGKQTVDQLYGKGQFLDGHTYVLAPSPGKDYEVTVLGDLHGCYSCLKGALMQAQFVEKVEAYRRDPNGTPDPKLVLLGDYIDRGRFGLNGVLRTLLELLATYPEHVFMLRGNHEYFLEKNGNVFSGVLPAESIASLKGAVPVDHWRAYKELFEAMPGVLLFGRTLFVHGGIPKDEAIKRWRGLDSLNEPDVRFQMLWSDPSKTDFIPPELQAQNARFPFGRLQFRNFMTRLGCNLMIRGHEKVTQGIKEIYSDPDIRLITLFSAGGTHNNDLPANSNYRAVTPMALTIQERDHEQTITPWPIDYMTFNRPDQNAFFAAPLEFDIV